MQRDDNYRFSLESKHCLKRDKDASGMFEIFYLCQKYSCEK